MTDAAMLMTRLQAATEGLLWGSEIDAPVEACMWSQGVDGALTAEGVLKLIGRSPETPIEERGVEECFAGMTEEQDWFGEEERATALRYRELLEVLQRSLDDLRVFWVGEVKVDVYVVGRAGAGEWMGVKTQVEET